jgi:hypothetical protein
VATRFLPFLHVRPPEVQLCDERIMGTTVKGQVRGGVSTAHAERLSMVQLEIVRFTAAFAALVDIRAARAIPLVDSSTHGGWDVPAFPGLSWLRRSFLSAFQRVRRGFSLRLAYLELDRRSHERCSNAALFRRHPLAACPSRLIRYSEPLLFERSDQHPHRLQVQLAQRFAGHTPCEQRLRALDEPHVLLRGAELHLVVLRPCDRWQLVRQ